LYVEGNGELEEEIRTVPKFTQLASSDNFHVFYEYSNTTEVVVSCESNLMFYIETVVLNDQLRIKTPNNVKLQTNETIEIYVKSPYLDKISLSGSGLIVTDLIEATQLDINVSGSGNVETSFYGESFESKISGSGTIQIYSECNTTESIISGSGRLLIDGFANTASFKLSGSGRIEAYNFPLKILNSTLSGSGKIYVNVSTIINANISGSGEVHYIDYPLINSNISGSGRIVSKN
jgi:hypothetical protein